MALFYFYYEESGKRIYLVGLRRMEMLNERRILIEKGQKTSDLIEVVKGIKKLSCYPQRRR